VGRVEQEDKNKDKPNGSALQTTRPIMNPNIDDASGPLK